jgi:hypothetical protein
MFWAPTDAIKAHNLTRPTYVPDRQCMTSMAIERDLALPMGGGVHPFAYRTVAHQPHSAPCKVTAEKWLARVLSITLL